MGLDQIVKDPIWGSLFHDKQRLPGMWRERDVRTKGENDWQVCRKDFVGDMDVLQMRV
jgi:hypothetical protein